MEVPRRLVSAFPFNIPFPHRFRSFDSSVWPDPAAMAAKVKNLTGAEMMVSLWPSVEDLSVNYFALQEQGLLAMERGGTGITDSFAGVYTRLSRSRCAVSYGSSSPGTTVDSTNPAAREFLCRPSPNL